MSRMTLPDLSKKMAEIDFAMLSTRAKGGQIAARPMSNNGDVEYRGDSWFFALDSTHTVADILRDPQVGLSFVGAKGLLGKPPIFISVEGKADIIRDRRPSRRTGRKISTIGSSRESTRPASCSSRFTRPASITGTQERGRGGGLACRAA